MTYYGHDVFTPLTRNVLAEGLEHWRSGRLSDAAEAIRNAIAAVEGEYRPEYYESLGAVLVELGELAEARVEFETAVRVASAQAPNAAASVVTARYFLAEHLLATGHAEDALMATESSMAIGAQAQAILNFIRALALHQLGRTQEAKAEARAATEGALSAEQREHFAARLRHVTGPAV